MLTLRAGIAQTRSLVESSATQLPALSNFIKARTVRGRKLAETVSGILAGPELKTVIDFIRVHGVNVLGVREEASLANLRLYPAFESPSKACSFPVVAFNPKYLAGRKPQDQSDAVEHELWHLYLRVAFPRFAENRSLVSASLAFVAPQLLPSFWLSSEHFFLRTAAILSGRADFAARDSRVSLAHHLANCSSPEFMRIPEVHLDFVAAGFFLDFVLPFCSCGGTAGDVAKTNTRDLLIWMLTIPGLSGRAFQLADELTAVCRDRSGNVRVDDSMLKVSDLIAFRLHSSRVAPQC